jgi:2'-5' RNA ligase
VQVAKLLFTHAKEDMGQHFFKTRDLLTSIQCLRMNKIVQGIQQIQGPVTITLRNLSSFECNQVRHIFLNGMDHFHELAELVTADTASQGSMSHATAPL